MAPMQIECIEVISSGILGSGIGQREHNITFAPFVRGKIIIDLQHPGFGFVITPPVGDHRGGIDLRESTIPLDYPTDTEVARIVEIDHPVGNIEGGFQCDQVDIVATIFVVSLVIDPAVAALEVLNAQTEET